MGSRRQQKVNSIGLSRDDYKGRPSTLCAGCGHDSISSQIIAVAYDVGIKPTNLMKFSGIGCSSKSPTYFLSQSHGFNSLHGRMPSVATGAMMMNHNMLGIGVSGDGDTASIGMGQFKHIMRRNVRMVYIIENNGVYGLTKGQFSATADEGQSLKYAGTNELPPIDICMEAILAGAGFVARSFSGDPKQVRELLKAAIAFRGTAVLDIISPCVTFNNRDESTKSYGFGKENEEPLHDINWVPVREEIVIDDYEPGTVQQVVMHDGSIIELRKLEEDYDPTDKMGALHRLQWAQEKTEFITGLIYINNQRESLAELDHLGDTPVSRMGDDKLRPTAEKLNSLVDTMRF